jgi:hypothetical protein
MAHPPLAPRLARSSARARRNLLADRARPGPLRTALFERLFLARPECTFEHHPSPRSFVRAVIGVWPMAMDLLFPGAVKEGLPPVIKNLIRWRHRNGLSQRGAVEVLQAYGLEVSISGLQQWERGAREPAKLATKALSDFLARHPRIENPPRYRPGPK